MNPLLVALALSGTAIRPFPDMRGDLSIRPDQSTVPPPTAIDIDALPYTRTLVCGSYTLTGTSAGADLVEWSVSPGSASGACSGTDTWSCVVTVSPTSAATATPTVTVTASTSGGELTDTVALGFFPGSAYSCYLAQNVDASYNSTLANGDAVATWQDSTTNNRDLTQGTAGAQPSVRLQVVGANSQPMVSCDGGDVIAASTAAAWTFLHNGSPRTVVGGAITRSDNPTVNQTLASNKANTDASRGYRLLLMDSGINDSVRLQVGDNSAGILTVNLAADTAPSARLNLITDVVDDDPGDDGFIYANDLSTASAAATGPFSASNGSALALCASASSPSGYLTGMLSHLITYDRLLTSGEIDAAEAAAEWAYGQTAPAAIPASGYWPDWGITLDVGGVQTWESRGIDLTIINLASASTKRPTQQGSGQTRALRFDGVNDYIGTFSAVAGPGCSANDCHIIVVVTLTEVTTNGTGANCFQNDKIWGSYYNNWWGLLARNTGTGYKAIAWGTDGTTDCVETDIDLNARTIVEYRHTGGQLGIAINGGAFTEVAHGATSNMSANGHSFGGSDAGVANPIGMDLHEARAYRRALPTTQRAEIIAALKATWGIP